MRVHYCSTNYNLATPLDINPLLLQLYKETDLLVLVAKEQQKERLLDYLEECTVEHSNKVDVAGWWELELFDIIRFNKLYVKGLLKYKAIIIVSRNRIDSKFVNVLKAIESLRTNQ